jgi:hypothetical protein
MPAPFVLLLLSLPLAEQLPHLNLSARTLLLFSPLLHTASGRGVGVRGGVPSAITVTFS